MYDREDALIDLSFVQAMLWYRGEAAVAAQKWAQLDVYDLESDTNIMTERLNNILKYIIPDGQEEIINNPIEAERSEEPKE